MVPQEKQMTIGQLAKAAGVRSSTVRFYERKGLLIPDNRRGTGHYRLYGQSALDHLRFIREAQRAGFTLKDIETLFSIDDSGPGACAAVQKLIESRLGQVSEQIAQLNHTEEILMTWRSACDRAKRQGRCPVLRDLYASTTRANSGKNKA